MHWPFKYFPPIFNSFLHFSELEEHIRLTSIRFYVSIHDDMGCGQFQVRNFRAERPETGKRNKSISNKLIFYIKCFPTLRLKQFKVIEFVEAEKCCAGCKKTFQNLKLCARCNSVLYCSKECQCSHWPQHKLVCNKHE
jgi:hypothetical protein